MKNLIKCTLLTGLMTINAQSAFSANQADTEKKQISISGSIGYKSHDEEYTVSGTKLTAKVKQLSFDTQVGFAHKNFEFGPELLIDNEKITDTAGAEGKTEFQALKGFFDYHFIEMNEKNKWVPYAGVGLGYGLGKIVDTTGSYKGDGLTYDIHAGVKFFPIEAPIALNFKMKYYKRDLKVDSNPADLTSYEEDGTIFNIGLIGYFNI